jgi:hypothetical protein
MGDRAHGYADPEFPIVSDSALEVAWGGGRPARGCVEMSIQESL